MEESTLVCPSDQGTEIELVLLGHLSFGTHGLGHVHRSSSSKGYYRHFIFWKYYVDIPNPEIFIWPIRFLFLLDWKKKKQINETFEAKDMKILFWRNLIIWINRRRRGWRKRSLVFSSDPETVLIRVRSTVHRNCVPTTENCLHCHLQ